MRAAASGIWMKNSDWLYTCSGRPARIGAAASTRIHASSETAQKGDAYIPGITYSERTSAKTAVAAAHRIAVDHTRPRMRDSDLAPTMRR
jgi:hypothetical protein